MAPRWSFCPFYPPLSININQPPNSSHALSTQSPGLGWLPGKTLFQVIIGKAWCLHTHAMSDFIGFPCVAGKMLITMRPLRMLGGPGRGDLESLKAGGSGKIWSLARSIHLAEERSVRLCLQMAGSPPPFQRMMWFTDLNLHPILSHCHGDTDITAYETFRCLHPAQLTSISFPN